MSAMTQTSRAFWVALALMLAACTGSWHPAPEKVTDPHWVVRLPQGWMQLSTGDSEMFSKDGAYLEYILVQSTPLTHGFRYTNQKIAGNMLPHEAAGVIIDNMRSDPFIRQFHLLSNEPATLGGHAGFKLTYSYRDQYDVTLKSIYYGAVLPDQFFNLRYTGAQRYYFDKEFPAFAQALQSLRLVSD